MPSFKRISQESFYNMFFVLGIFILVYNPPIFMFNSMHIVGFISLCYIFILKKLRIKLNREPLYVLSGFLLLSIYIVLFCVILNGNSIAQAAFPVYFIIDILPFGAAMKLYAEKHFKTIDWTIEIMLVAAMIESLLSVLAFFNASVQHFFVDRMIQYGYSEGYSILSSYRLFGFSNSLTSAMPTIQCFMAIVAVAKGLEKGFKYYLIALLLAFSAIINTRTSFVVLVVGSIAFLMWSSIEREKKTKSIVFILLTTVILIWGVLPQIQNISPLTYEWITEGFEEFKMLSGGIDSFGKYTYFGYINNVNRFVLPKGLFSKLFGVGYTILSSKNPSEYQSDIGYINDIWFGGFVYVIIAYYLFGKIMIDVKKSNNKYTKLIGLLFLFSVPFLNFKGMAFTMNAYMNFLVILYIQKGIVSEDFAYER